MYSAELSITVVLVQLGMLNNGINFDLPVCRSEDESKEERFSAGAASAITLMLTLFLALPLGILIGCCARGSIKSTVLLCMKIQSVPPILCIPNKTPTKKWLRGSAHSELRVAVNPGESSDARSE